MEYSLLLMQKQLLGILSADSLKEVYELSVKKPCKFAGAEYGSLFLGKEGNLYRVYSTLPLKIQVDPRQKGNSFRCYSQQKTILISNQELKKIHPQQVKAGINSVLIIPLGYQNRPLGVLSLLFTKKINLDEERKIFCQIIGSTISLAIEKARKIIDLTNTVSRKELYMSMAAHEIKIPLTTINLYIQLLTKKSRGSKLYPTKWLGTLAYETKRLTALVNDLLHTQTISNDKDTYHRHRFNVKDFIGRAMIEIYSNYPDHKFEVKYPGNGEIYLWGDENKLLQVLLNVLSNAAKYTKGNKPITIEVKRMKSELIISIVDKGQGIAAKDLPHIFNRFYKGSDNRHEGMGLGLYIAKDIVKSHYGDIKVDSKLGKGTRITIVLPLVKHERIHAE